MFSEFLKNFVWLDICGVIIVTRACWIGLQKGTLVEVFKFLAVILALFLGLHLYVDFSKVIIDIVSIVRPIAPVLSFVFIVFLVILFFCLIREGIVVLFKNDEVSSASKVAGFVLGFCRGVLLGGLLFLGCLITDSQVLKHSVRNSFSGEFLVSVDTKIYSGMFRFIVQPLFLNEQKNKGIQKLRQNSRRTRD